MIYRHRVNTYRYLDACTEIEKCAALMYTQFARQEKANSRLQKIWLKLAAEERQHVKQLELLSGLARQLKLGTRQVDCDRMVAFAAQAEHCLNHAFKMSYDPFYAGTLAVSLESWLLDLHAEQTERFPKDRFGSLFNALAVDDLQHINKIQMMFNESIDHVNDLRSYSFTEMLSFC